ncbi:hypothetical protein [Niabella ginsengisoli]|uniref:ABC transporter ATP-binding protein n=1 Tax=Niabella ginsengisoli TaxID=522298 RepID=A0ABS9SMH2_9BACT|nr:hypothetical protein [Niabella ginsengisoli]MCH5599555.1 hypothetical protein [Niabella ginsengisoli]
MKKFSRIFKYIGLYKGKIALYISLTILGSSLSVVSLGMLAPLMSIIFNEPGIGGQNILKKLPGGDFLGEKLLQLVNSGHQMQAVLICCVLVIASVF